MAYGTACDDGGGVRVGWVRMKCVGLTVRARTRAPNPVVPSPSHKVGFGVQLVEGCLASWPALERLLRAQEMMAEVARFREQGRAALAAERYDDAADAYTAAMRLTAGTPNVHLKSVLMSNRAAVRMFQSRCVVLAADGA
jgi:hypothetical protein